MAAKNANVRKYNTFSRVRVMCPVCGSGGAHDTSMNQPKCHICPGEVYMEPASNDKVECTWHEFIDYHNKLKQ